MSLLITGQQIKEIDTKKIGYIIWECNSAEPIPYFYLDLAVLGDVDKIKRTEIAEREADEFLSGGSVGEWWKVVPNGVWPLKYFGKFNRDSLTEENDDWEKRLNDKVRKKLIKEIEQKYKQYEEKKVKMIITRACKYPSDEPMDIGD